MTKEFVIHGATPTGPAGTTEKVSLIGPLVSILIPCCGMLEYTMLCVPSVLKHTRRPFELIFIDIGSLDGTAEYLKGVATVHPEIRVEIVRTATDLGIKNAVKQALNKVRGEYIVLLNNDTIVTNAWVNQLVGLVQRQPQHGAAGPMSNYAAPPQLVQPVPYRVGPRKRSSVDALGGEPEALVDVEAVDSFAREFREKHKGKWMEAFRLGGFCMLLKREVLTRIGPLDPWTDLGLFDTDILSMKARQAGFSLACCRDLFIHHFGTRTFAAGAPKEDRKQENVSYV